jgi:hypothetical protein
MRARFLLLSVLLLSLTTVPQVAAQNCTDPDTQLNCTGREAYDIYRKAELQKRGIAVEAMAVEAVDKEVTNSNRSTEPPDPYAQRIHNSYQDFLNLFGFAINKIDEAEDGQALTIRFNPLRNGAHLLGLTVTASKPVIAESVKNAIPETGRTDVVTKLEKQVDDLDDLTIAASYSLQTVSCPMQSQRRCYGRSASTYRDVLAHALAPLFAAAPALNAERQQALKVAIARQIPPALLVANPNLDVFTVPIGQVTSPDVMRQALKDFAVVEAQQTFDEKAFFSKQNLDVLATLVDNQPQVSFTGSYRSPGQLGGPNQTALTAELQVGNENLNTLRGSCRIVTDVCLNQALMSRLRDGVSTTKWVLTASYTRNDSFKLADLGLPDPVTGFVPVDLKSSSELIIKGQGGRVLGAAVGTQNVRGDLSLEGHRVENDRTRTTNRWLARATITLPLGDNISVPVSLTYANKAEFLGEQDEQLGAHLGLSYRLPMRPSVPK